MRALSFSRFGVGLLVALAMTACGGSSDGDSDKQQSAMDAGGSSSNTCTPTRARFDQVEPLLRKWCGQCHTTTPQFGAPFSLIDYDSLIGHYEGEAVTSRMSRALTSRIMPPAEQPQPTSAERQQLIAFATCASSATTTDGGTTGQDGGEAPDAGEPPSEGLMATRNPLMAGMTTPAGATSKELTAQEYAVAANARDDYESFTFKNIVAQDAFIRRFDPVLDDTRVVHHLTLRFTSSRQGYLYTWAPGGPSIEFPDGGIRLKPDDTLLLEIHYNNGVGATGVNDSSGVRIWMSDPAGTEYGLANLASWQIVVPKGTRSSASATCNVQNAVTVFAAAPHMHGIGDSFEHKIHRAAGGDEDLVSLTGWSFNAQRYYEVGVSLAPGDRLDMKCNYYNRRDRDVSAGIGTGDEMCFDFMYVTPPNALANCNDSTSL